MIDVSGLIDALSGGASAEGGRRPARGPAAVGEVAGDTDPGERPFAALLARLTDDGGVDRGREHLAAERAAPGDEPARPVRHAGGDPEHTADADAGDGDGDGEGHTPAQADGTGPRLALAADRLRAVLDTPQLRPTTVGDDADATLGGDGEAAVAGDVPARERRAADDGGDGDGDEPEAEADVLEAVRAASDERVRARLARALATRVPGEGEEAGHRMPQAARTSNATSDEASGAPTTAAPEAAGPRPSAQDASTGLAATRPGASPEPAEEGARHGAGARADAAAPTAETAPSPDTAASADPGAEDSSAPGVRAPSAATRPEPASPDGSTAHGLAGADDPATVGAAGAERRRGRDAESDEAIESSRTEQGSPRRASEGEGRAVATSGDGPQRPSPSSARTGEPSEPTRRQATAEGEEGGGRAERAGDEPVEQATARSTPTGAEARGIERGAVLPSSASAGGEGGAVGRVMAALSQLRQAGPPRSVSLELPEMEGLRVRVSLRGARTVDLGLDGARQDQSLADWLRDLEAAVAGRGLQLGDVDHGGAGRRPARDHHRPDGEARPQPTTAVGGGEPDDPRRGLRL